jgi:putative ABC transport system permease protein
LLSIIAIMLGVALGYSIYIMNRATTAEVAQAARSLFGEADLVVQGTHEGFDEALYPVVARTPGVAVASPVVEVETRVPGRNFELTVLGVDLLREWQLRQVTTGGRDDRLEGLWFFEPQNAMLSAQAARALNVDVEDRVTIQVGAEPVTFTVKSILTDDVYSGAVMVMDIAVAQWRLHTLGRLHRISVRVAKGANPAQVAEAIAQRLPAHVKVSTPAIETQQARRLSRAFTTNMTALALVALFTGGFLVYSTQSLAVMRRRKEIALLNALGLTRRQQLRAIVLSGAIVGVLGAVAGIGLGRFLAEAGLRNFLGRLGEQSWIPTLRFDAIEAAVFVMLGVAVSIAGSIAPALAAVRIPTARALKAGNAEERVPRGHAHWAFVSWLLAAITLLAPPLDGMPIPGYVSIALILFGAVFLIPTITRRLLEWLPDGGNVVYQTALAQMRGAAHGASVSVASILVSVSLMVAMAIMITSLRTSFIDSLNRALPADVYVNAPRGNPSAYLDAALVDRLASISGVERIETSRSTQILLDRTRPPVTLLARPLDTERPQASLSLESETRAPPPPASVPIWISVQLATEYGLEAGDVLPFTLGDRKVTGAVRGIWRDNGRSAPAFVMPIDVYRELSGDTRSTTVGIWVSEDVGVEQVLRELRGRLPTGIDIELGLPSEIRADRLRAFDRIFAITYVLLAVAVLIGLFGISVSSSAQALARRAEFGVLRHLGFTRAQIGRMLAIEGLSLGSLGMIGSLVVGGIISLVLIHVVGRQSFYWSMDLHIPYVPLLALTLIVPLAAAITALVSGRSAMDADVVRAVKEDW